MGKRKTRKRSRRSKRGGNIILKMLGIDELCIWYGTGNKGGINNEMKKSFWNKPICGDCCNTSIKDFVAPHAKFYAISTTPQNDFVPNDKSAVFNPKNIEGQKIPTILTETEVYNGSQEGKYDVYAIRYQKNCGHGGQRYQLFKLKNARISGKIGRKPDDIPSKVTVTIGSNIMIFETVEGKGNDKMKVTFNDKTIEGVDVESFLLKKSSNITRRNTIMGGKKKRRRRTKKKSRKKRKRTKKRRRRR